MTHLGLMMLFHLILPTDDNSCPTGKHEECDGEQVCINQECVDPENGLKDLALLEENLF